MLCKDASCVPLGLSLLLLFLISLAGLAIPIHAASSPDLTVESIWLEKASERGHLVNVILSGESFHIVVTVKNIGEATAYGYYLDVYYDSEYGRGGPDDIALGEVQEWYVGPFTAQSGTHTTRWVVDPDNQIAELNELNNEKQYLFTVGSQTVTTTTTSSSTTTSTVESTVSTTTTRTTSTYYTTSSQTAPPTLTLNPNSGGGGTFVSVSGLNYQGITCSLSSVPASLFSSQACSVVAGTLTGNLTVASAAPAGDYTVTAETNVGPGDSATSTFTVTPTCTVTFYTDPRSAAVIVDGATKIDAATGTYLAGQRVHVVASPPPGDYSFSNWETSGVSVDSQSSQDAYVTVSNDGWLKAHFAQTQYTVTLFTRRTDGSAMGGVQVTFGGQDRMTDSSGKVEFSVPAGTYILLVQAAVNGGSGIQYLFAEWTDGNEQNPRSITVNASATYDAKYKTQYLLTIQVNPSGSAATSPPVGTYWYDSGQTVSIQVSPASEYTFRSWTGSGSGSYSGTANAASITMNGPVSATANLSKINDARINRVALAPDPAVQGSITVFTIGVKNVGTSKINSAKVEVKIYRPDGSLAGSGSAYILRLQAGTEKTVQITYPMPPSAPVGVWTYRVSVYLGTTLLDQKTDGSFTVNSALIAGSITSVSDSPDPVARPVNQRTARTVNFSVTIKNTGNVVWPSASIAIHIYGPDGILVKTSVLTVNNTQPGVEYSYKIGWSVPSTAPRGICHYDVYLKYGSILIDSSASSGNTITVS